MMDEKISIQYWVSGKVQGVFYRASTQQKAEQLALTGWVRNLPDGRVAVLASGERDKLLQFSEWLKQGPPRAMVIEVVAKEVVWQEHTSFKVLR